MLSQLRKKLNILRGKKTEDPDDPRGGERPETPEMQRIKKVVRRQALLAGGTLLIVVILLFAMTSAWYTNVSKTGTIRLRTEVWGFDPDNISVGGTNGTGEPTRGGNQGAIISDDIAPGRSGIVPLTVDNSSGTDGVSIRVTVSKTGMSSDDLRKRIYFYADTVPHTVNGENVSRVYLGSTDSDFYSYTVLPGNRLIMTDDYYNDVPLKWEWVYDVEGYYFLGTVGSGSATLNEYLRPIEYDLDRATFDLAGENPTGRLVSANGATLDQFLTALSSTDGYVGQFASANAVTVGNTPYYPVSVNESGYGVWAYLLTYGEIEQEISYDTNFSSGEVKEISASLNVTAVNLPSRVESARTGDELWAALRSDSVEVVELTNDVSVSSSVSITTGTTATLDLNGFTITYTGSGSAINVRGGSSLTVINGSIVGDGTGSGTPGAVSTAAIQVSAGEVTLSHVEIGGFDTAVYVYDANETRDSVVRIYESTLDTVNTAVALVGNGSGSEAPSRLIAQGSVLNSQTHAAVAGYASEGHWGTDVVLLDSTVSGRLTALYQPQQKSASRIYNSTLSGATGLVAKGGTVAVKNSRVTGTGTHGNAAAAADGWTSTGDGIYVEATFGWNATVTVDGTSSVIGSNNSYAVELFGQSGSGKGTVMLNDGTFSGGNGSANWNSIGTFDIYGGTYNNSVADGIARFDA